MSAVTRECDRDLIYGNLLNHLIDGEEIIVELTREHVDYAPRTSEDDWPFMSPETGHRYRPCELTAVEGRTS